VPGSVCRHHSAQMAGICVCGAASPGFWVCKVGLALECLEYESTETILILDTWELSWDHSSLGLCYFSIIFQVKGVSLYVVLHGFGEGRYG
jgi:hypothetical protein